MIVLEDSETVVEYVCGYEPHHVHILPGDWAFSGANELDPRGDTRWRPSTYTYFDDKLNVLHITQVPFCDDEAIDRFTEIASYGADYNPVWIQVKRPDGDVETLPVTYNKSTDEVYDKE